MRVLALSSYPVEAAGTRFRLTQFVEPLAQRGIELDLRPFLSGPLFAELYRPRSLARKAAGLTCSVARRARDVIAARGFDAVLVQREAMLLGPPVVERLVSTALKKPMVLDLDDATYLSYKSPTYGRVASYLKWFGKTDDLIRWSRVVTCGNRAIAEYVSRAGRPTVVIPTVVDQDVFRPADGRSGGGPTILGWVGSHSTFPYLESVFPALERLARHRRFRLKVVGAGRDAVSVPGVEIECLAWSLGREVDDFRSLDVGLYPVVDDGWSAGKSAFKAIEYMAVGVPYVVSPVGACAEVGEPGVTHFEATSEGEWFEALDRLLRDEALRLRMGEAGRRHALENFGLEAQADKLAGAIRFAAGAAPLPSQGHASGVC